VTDNRGQIAVPKLEERGLRALAGIGGGRYARISTDDRDLDTLLTGEVSGGAVIGDNALATDRWREEGPWLLLLLLPLAALAFRRGWVLLALIFIVPLPQPAHAASWDDLWLNKDQQAHNALKAGKPEDAAALFENPDWQAVADYRSGDYAGSARVFAESSDTRNLYNLANAMALQGELDSAIDTYTQVLETEPDNEDASYNLELVKGLKDQQEQEQQNQGDDQQSTENPGGEGEESDSESQADQQGEEGGSQSEGEPSEGDPSQSEEMSEEDMKALQEELRKAAEEADTGEQPKQISEAELAELRQQQEQDQAMEQWLRRVPDDPGGLLRRKFRHQYQRSGMDQDGNAVWPDNEVQPW
jgi:Ca-activated chloride channel family protein